MNGQMDGSTESLTPDAPSTEAEGEQNSLARIQNTVNRRYMYMNTEWSIHANMVPPGIVVYDCFLLHMHSSVRNWD